MTVRTSRNPAFARMSVFSGRGDVGLRSTDDPLEQAYLSPSATAQDTGRMTIESVVNRTGLILAVAIVAGAFTWIYNLEVLALPAALIGFALALVIIFKQVTNPGAILAYAAAEGVFLGGVSHILNVEYPGIAVQAVIGTAAVAVGMLALYRSGRIRVTAKFTKVVIGATLGFVALIVANLLASLFVDGGLGLREGPLGIVVGLVAIVLGALNLVLDFDMIEEGVRRGVPERYGWQAAFGLMVTLVWIYVEMLRLIAILRGDR